MSIDFLQKIYKIYYDYFIKNLNLKNNLKVKKSLFNLSMYKKFIYLAYVKINNTINTIQVFFLIKKTLYTLLINNIY